MTRSNVIETTKVIILELPFKEQANVPETKIFNETFFGILLECSVKRAKFVVVVRDV